MHPREVDCDTPPDTVAPAPLAIQVRVGQAATAV